MLNTARTRDRQSIARDRDERYKLRGRRQERKAQCWAGRRRRPANAQTRRGPRQLPTDRFGRVPNDNRRIRSVIGLVLYILALLWAVTGANCTSMPLQVVVLKVGREDAYRVRGPRKAQNTAHGSFAASRCACVNVGTCTKAYDADLQD